ncbi:MAG: hypothetical protein J1F12_00930 [Muribaculaceae bacterium]|nr:hypothetical protein [Muribaculaceae bacterium]
MKTLKSIIRELFSERNASNQRVENETIPAAENQQTVINHQNQDDETENHEMDGSDRLDTSIDQQDDRDAEKFQESVESGDGDGDGEGERSGTDADTGTGTGENEEDTEREIEREITLTELPEFKAALEKAYNEGVIAGRNQKIEELHFPKKEDNIPAFKGITEKPVQTNIFSIAREA